MGSFIIGFFTVLLVLVSLFMVLVILMQRPSANAGMGSALGGGLSESTFGAESANVLSRWTIYCAVAFFVISLGLGLAYMGKPKMLKTEPNGGLPSMVAPADNSQKTGDPVPGSLTDIPAKK